MLAGSARRLPLALSSLGAIHAIVAAGHGVLVVEAGLLLRRQPLGDALGVPALVLKGLIGMSVLLGALLGLVSSMLAVGFLRRLGEPGPVAAPPAGQQLPG